MFRIWRTAAGFAHGMGARIDRAQLSLVAAGGAFFAMLSLFPGLAAVIALLGFVADPAIVDDQLPLLRDFIPQDAYLLLEGQILRLVSANTSTLGWATLISTLAALWSARRGTDAVIQALNAVHGTSARGHLTGALAALLITLALIAVAVVAAVAMLVLPVILAFVPLGRFAELGIETGRWAVALSVILSGIWVLYRFAPTGPAARVRWLSPGAVFGLLVWAGASYGFSWYLSNFASYNEVYGSIGAVIALLMFLYITIFAVLLGACLNAELRAERSQAGGEAGPAQPSAGGAAGLATLPESGV